MIRMGHDPECEFQAHGVSLKMPFSHDLPLYYASFPFYDRLPARLARFLKDRGETIVAVDVGANIGDTVSAFRVDAEDQFLAIEPNPRFYEFLIKNHGETITALPLICSARDELQEVSIVQSKGTASLVSSKGGAQIEAKSLDSIVQSVQKDFGKFNVIKVDTDGHDFEVLRGALRTIKENRPAVLFECDPFSNPRYLEDVVEIVRALGECGYERFLVYDNKGYFLTRLFVSDKDGLEDLLGYQLLSKNLYFDLLFLAEDSFSEFVDRERSFFRKQLKTS